MKRPVIKVRNPVARQLRTPQFRKQVVRSPSARLSTGFAGGTFAGFARTYRRKGRDADSRCDRGHDRA